MTQRSIRIIGIHSVNYLKYLLETIRITLGLAIDPAHCIGRVAEIKRGIPINRRRSHLNPRETLLNLSAGDSFKINPSNSLFFLRATRFRGWQYRAPLYRRNLIPVFCFSPQETALLRDSPVTQPIRRGALLSMLANFSRGFKAPFVRRRSRRGDLNGYLINKESARERSRKTWL